MKNLVESTRFFLSKAGKKTLLHKERVVLYSVYLIGLSLLLRLFSVACSDLLVEEAYYWNYATHLDFSYLDHPPMVAVLIRLSTAILGVHELGVRMASVICWVWTAFFSYKLTNLIVHKGKTPAYAAGLYAVLLLAVLPFFFLHSLVMTPDLPLIVCWAACLYYVYRALVLNDAKAWYWVGIWLGLGLLSKYTIVLLGPAIFLYLGFVPEARIWLVRKEPYFAVFIAALLFTPVIYWNATHDWASFVFQSTRRFNAATSFSLHHFLGLLFFFLTPLGVWELWKLCRKDAHALALNDLKSRRFLQVFALVPLVFFAAFSLSHGIKFNWIGPSLLAIVPWIAARLFDALQTNTHYAKHWLRTGLVLLFGYSVLISGVVFGVPDGIYKAFLKKYIAWDALTQTFYTVANRTEVETASTPVFVPLDLYNIGSELAFYQAKHLAHGDIDKAYPIVGRHIFGDDSLMFRYWAGDLMALKNKILILITTQPADFDRPLYGKQLTDLSPVNTVWSHNQGRGENVTPYYYKVVRVK